jgi:CRISPR-associated endonuclease/helicase Cas3
MQTYYAHSTDSEDKADWQTLPDHLNNVADKAEEFASVFGAAEWGRVAGLLHDAGKVTKAYQERAAWKAKRVNHFTFGGCLARGCAEKFSLMLPYEIAGQQRGPTDGGEQAAELH